MARKKYQLGWVDIKLSQLVKADWNYKTEDEEQSRKLKNNIERNGVIENILVRRLDNGSYEVVNGNHRLDVMNSLKMKECHAYNLGEISKEKAIRVAIETNETRFGADGIKLSHLIDEISDNVGLQELEKSMPFTADEMQNMLDLLHFDWEVEEDAGEPLDLEEPDPFNFDINLKVSKETYDRWLDLRKKLASINGYDNESKVFEFAIIEALNIPIESIT